MTGLTVIFLHFSFPVDVRGGGLVSSGLDSVLSDTFRADVPAYMPMLKVFSSWWKCWVGSDRTRLESRQGCQTRPRPRETSLTRLSSGSPSMPTDWSGSNSMLSSETVRTRRLEPRSREMATKLWDHMV